MSNEPKIFSQTEYVRISEEMCPQFNSIELQNYF